jgi:4-hydroxyacetophenone monooxygenase
LANTSAEHTQTAVSGAVDDDFVRRALDQADVNALRLALYQATGDEELAAMQLARLAGASGANGSTDVVTLAPEDAETVKRKAFEFLRTDAGTFESSAPSDEELRRLMTLLVGREPTENIFRYGKDTAAFDEFPRAASWHGVPPEIPAGYSVAVIGAGFSGIAASIQLKRLGIPFTLYERREALGGTWRINTYPDARVDTTNFMFQYSFEKNYPWSEYFARQDEVCRYLEHVAGKYDVAGDIRYNVDVSRAVFDETEGRWTLTLVHTDGYEETAYANAVISGAGLFSTARRLDVPGAEDFEGTVLHTTEWLGDLDLTGKHAAVIGNGSTGVQLLSRIAEAAESTTVFQRTAQWIVPRAKYGDPILPETSWLLRAMPYYWNWYIWSMMAEGLGNQALQEPDAAWQAQGGLINEANDALRETMKNYISTQLASRPELVEKVTPAHAPMARRLIVDNRWYASLLRDDVELVTDEIERITPRGVVTVDGTERPADVIVTATGFSTTKYLYPAEYRGVGGVTLESAWESEGPRAHLGLTVPGFPNLFIMYGPNAQPRSGSTISVIEQWASYAVQSIVLLLEGGHRVMDVKRDVFDDYQERLDEASDRLIWVDKASIARNYYVNSFGRSQVNEPWRIEDYYAMIAAPNPEDFDFR